VKIGTLGAVGVLGLSGCLLDLYGGDPRLQCKNSSSVQVSAVGIGDPDDPTWIHELDPLLLPGKSSEVIDLPVAGDLRLWVRLTDTARQWDTVLLHPIGFEAGQFQLLEVSGSDRWKLSTLR
jgi:hypothetical protein